MRDMQREGITLSQRVLGRVPDPRDANQVCVCVCGVCCPCQRRDQCGAWSADGLPPPPWP